jgi:hypothetical protein
MHKLINTCIHQSVYKIEDKSPVVNYKTFIGLKDSCLPGETLASNVERREASLFGPEITENPRRTFQFNVS